MTHFEIVQKLIGNVSPYGASHIDEGRFENLKEMCYLASQIITELERVATNKDRHEHSMKEMGEYAERFLRDEIGIK